MNSERFPFFKTFILPMFWILVIPICGAVFAQVADSKYDSLIRDGIYKGIDAEAIGAAEKAELKAQYESISFADVCVSTEPELAEFRRYLDKTCGDYAQFGYIKLASWLAILMALLAILFIGVAGAASLKSRELQLLSLRVGVPLLKFVAATQMILQGFVLVMLSYWVTALFFNVFFVKIIFVVGFMALAGVGIAIRGIFRQVHYPFFVVGELLTREIAPELWASVDRICAELGTEPPNQIMAGIDDNFFVTEHTITLPDGELTGRTLFVSLSLLRHFSVEEAEAIIAHEMAHFSGGDTLFSLKTSPLLSRFDQYLAELNDFSTLMAFYLLNAFRGLMELSLGKHSRDREFRADKVAADAVGADHFGSALLKLAAYSQYRIKIEDDLFSKDEKHAKLTLADRINAGFRDYACSPLFSDGIAESSTPHPFDSHPLMIERLAKFGVFSESEFGEVASRAPEHLILKGDSILEMEQRQWAEYEEQFQKAHSHFLCYRSLPSNEDEIAHVEHFFPEQVFEQKKSMLGKKHGDIVLRYDSVYIPQLSPDPFHFSDVTEVLFIEDQSQIQVFTTLQKNPFKGTVAVPIILEIGAYHERYKSAEEWLATRSSPED